MKLVLAATLSLFATSATAQDVFGTWQTQPGDTGGVAHVSMVPCGDKVCGTLIGAFEANGTPVPDFEHTGKPIVWDMTADGDGKWNEGKIWAPDRDKTYASRMELNGDSLKVSGCVAAVLCRSQNWIRVQ